MEAGSLAAWAAVAIAVASLVNTWVMVRSKASADAHKDLADKVDKVEERVAIVEAEVQHLPDRETTHAMELAFRDLKGEVGVLVERVGTLARTSERLQEFLLSQGR